ncbi:hypothetical protein LINPERPRIM_LOCUS14638 [Linum perenne]
MEQKYEIIDLPYLFLLTRRVVPGVATPSSND